MEVGNNEIESLTLYIMGPMTFRKDTDFNYPAFNNAARVLRQCGYTVLCPTEVDPECGDQPPTPDKAKSWDWYMRRTLAQVLQADAIAVITDDLKALFESEGAQTEHFIARKLKMPMKPVSEWVSMAIKTLYSTKKEQQILSEYLDA